MSDAVRLPVLLWHSALELFAENTDTPDESSGPAVGGFSQIQDVGSLQDVVGSLMKKNPSTCTFGVLLPYIDAVRQCACSNTNVQAPLSGSLKLRMPSAKGPCSAPDVEELLQTVLHFADMNPGTPGHRQMVSVDDFVTTISHLHASVLPLVFQALYKETGDYAATVGTNDNLTTSLVMESPNFYSL